jgi:tRNA pseudouridine38-40 synthase
METSEHAERNIRLTLAYDGTRYHGWQRQQDQITLQGILEEAVQRIVGESVNLIGSGRTDAGVHARKQVCNFKTRTTIEPEALRRALNSVLPEDVFVSEVHRVSPDFHARYSAKSKIYEYRIWNREKPNLFQRRYVWHVRAPLDVQSMAGCADGLVGTRDFSAFRSAGSRNTDPVRTVMRAEWSKRDDGIVGLLIQADGFLRHMVRNMVGTMVQVGRGKLDSEEFQRIVGARDRRLAGVKAPARGLFLIDVLY